MKTTTKTTIKTLAVTLALLTGSVASAAERKANAGAEAARADMQKTFGFAPQFLLRFPEVAQAGAWEEMKGLQLNPHTALPPKLKELIGLAVAAQVPCHYCIVAHTEFAKLNGASEVEIGEAVTMAAITRHWSTFLNGIQTDDAAFRAEIKTVVDSAKRAGANPTPAPKPIAITDGASALRDINQTLGSTPDFLKRFPEAARAGAWREMKEVQMNPATALSGKYKELIGLAVASQVPCRFCVVAHTEFARLNGATDAEIAEAIAMASLTRNFSTMLNGLQVDESQFRRDVDRLVKGARAAEKAAGKSPRQTALAR
jgi:AhpD family alkylhydroperoxidase